MGGAHECVGDDEGCRDRGQVLDSINIGSPLPKTWPSSGGNSERRIILISVSAKGRFYSGFYSAPSYLWNAAGQRFLSSQRVS